MVEECSMRTARETEGTALIVAFRKLFGGSTYDKLNLTAEGQF
jgi:hypothetical protein